MALVKKIKTPFGDIRITRDRDGLLAYYQNGCFHSQATARGVSICAYVHVAYQIIFQKRAKKVLIIGCGGGTLATMLCKHDVHVTVVDINPAAFQIARDYFHMPDDVVCVAQNGLTYVRQTKVHFDAIVIDVFDSHNNVPSGFMAQAFLRAVKKNLRRGGVLLMNVIIKHAKDMRGDAVAKKMETAGLRTSLFEWSREKDSNIVVVGGAVSRVVIPWGREPVVIRQELKTLIRRKPKT